MKIAGITTVKNEVDVIDFCLNHHFDQGIDRIYISDNGSTDGTYEYLLEASKSNEKIHAFKNDGGFHQAKIINELYQLARKDGFDWVVPFDADELWMSENSLKDDLSGVDAFSVKVKTINFIQSTEYDVDNSYLTATWRIKNDYPVDVNRIFSGDLSMSEVESFQKFIIRTDENTYIQPGAHSYSGGRSECLDNDKFAIIHVPIRSFRALEEKANQGRALRDAGYPPDHGFHVQRYDALREQGLLFNEWVANSVKEGHIYKLNGEVVEVFYDDTVAKIYKKYKEGGRDK